MYFIKNEGVGAWMILYNRKYFGVTDYNGKMRWRKCSEIFSNVFGRSIWSVLSEQRNFCI